MKTNNKRILSIILALVMILSMLPMVALAATPSKLYLKPNSNWTVANARFAAYFFGNGEKWVSMTDSDNDGYYEVDVPSGYPKVIFCRMNGSTSANNWNNKWNQTGDLTIPTNGNNCFTVPSGSWDGATSSWSTYTPPVVETTPPTEAPTEPTEATTAPTEAPIVPRNITIHYRNIHLWESINIHAWIPEGNDLTTWPGMTISESADTPNWYTAELTDVQAESIGVLFNNGSAQTADFIFEGIPAENAEYWIDETVKNEDGTVTIQASKPADTWPDGSIDADPTITPVYLKPNANWKASSARFALHCFNDNGAAWFNLVDSDSDGVYEGAVPEIYTTIIFCRMDPATTENNWDNKWNQTEDLSVPTDDNNCYFITEGAWDKDGSWGILPPQQPEDPELPPDVLDYPETIYFLPNFNWASADATFAAYFYNNAAEYTWVSMSDSNGDGVYEAAVPEGMTSVIFCRMDPAAAEPSWDSKWNQSSDLAIPTDGTDLCLMAQGAWDSSSTDAPWADTWATYTEIPVPEFKSPVIDGNSVTFNYWHYGATSVSVHGSMDSWGEGYAMVKDENGLWSVTINDLADALYQYKFVVDGAWILDPANWETYDEYDDEGNIKNQNSKFILGTPVAEIYSVGEYFTFESAYAAADPDNGDSIVLLSDLTVNDLVVDKEMYLDLNGHDLTINAASATATIFAQDSATNDPNATEWGKLIVNGEATYSALGGYVMLPETEGHSFHSYTLDITHISLKPGDDALGYKAVLESNSRVLAAVTEIGFEFSANGGTPVTVTKAVTNANAEFTARLKNIMACGGGEMEITASAFMVVADETLWSNSETTSMKDTIQAVNTMELGDAQKTAVYGLYSQYASVMDAWLGESNNIKSWAPAE